jgi:hypothetical protein
VSPETASAWADWLIPVVEMAWSRDPERHGFFHGTMACFSAQPQSTAKYPLSTRRVAMKWQYAAETNPPPSCSSTASRRIFSARC